jgi:hypothetical protein
LAFNISRSINNTSDANVDVSPSGLAAMAKNGERKMVTVIKITISR